MKKELLKGLTEEQVVEAKACKNKEELIELAKRDGLELTEEQLAAVNGGFCSSSDFRWKCTNCGSSDTKVMERYNEGQRNEYVRVHCNKCGNNFTCH